MQGNVRGPQYITVVTPLTVMVQSSLSLFDVTAVQYCCCLQRYRLHDKIVTVTDLIHSIASCLLSLSQALCHLYFPRDILHRFKMYLVNQKEVQYV
jgi:hypothetical protein